jgi:hypothetical protein
MTEEEKETKEMTLPPQSGSIAVEGRKALSFWVRAFQLDEEIESVRKLIEGKPERKRAVVPIIAEYFLSERLKFIFVLKVDVDALGVQDGIGLVYWASPEYEKRAYERRDEFAGEIMKRLTTSRSFDEVIEIEEKKEE